MFIAMGVADRPPMLSLLLIASYLCQNHALTDAQTDAPSLLVASPDRCLDRCPDGEMAALTLLPQDRGDESPACLDGSPYGFYSQPAAKPSTKWTINLEGGGWCYDEAECYRRSQTVLGSSKKLKSTGRCPCMNVDEDGSIDPYGCNCLFLQYSDGASFSGFRAKPWPVPGTNKTLYFRGIKNLDAALDWAFAHGLDKATEFVLTGGSAGGLSTFLHADRVAARLAKDAPNCKHVRAAPIVGYFLDHDNIVHNETISYPDRMEYIYHMQNLTFGDDGGLMPACEAAYPSQPHYCFMSPHMQSFIKTPFFMFNSKFDYWQLANILQFHWREGRPWTEKEKAAVIRYGSDFLEQFAPVQSESKNGAMITSCICHGCPWPELKVEGTRAYQLYSDWYYGKTSGAAAIHIDSRGPNGDGALDKVGGCFSFHDVREESSSAVKPLRLLV